MIKLGITFSTALLLAGCATVPMAEGGAGMPAMQQTAGTAQPLDSATPTQLPRTAAPFHYTIEITPDMDALAFTGRSTVDLTVFEPTNTIVLNARDLDISSAMLVRADGTGDLPVTVTMDEDAQTASFHSDAVLQPGDYRLTTEYAGTINQQANGLFALDYPDKRDGSDKRALFTQFEAPDARRFAPMFDEPSYKATFDLSAIVPADLMPLSNMPVKLSEEVPGGKKRVVFATSPKMSSYLLFFGLGDFERAAKQAAPGVEAGIVGPAGSGEQLNFALDELAKLVPYFNSYFGQKYPLPKIDNIAGPGQSQFFGAMENWGAIFTFERILLNDPSITSAGTRKSISQVQAHETAHQWFGDLVTMAWWDDLWLNEGFASWMETKASDHFHPEWYPLLDRVGGREAAMGLDSFVTTHPIVQEIRTVEQTNQAFDAITYQKGEAVISMLEAYATPGVWQKGLQRYMAANKYSNARTEELWQAVEAAGATGLTSIARDFTTQPGIPLVRVTNVTCSGGRSTVSLAQSEFSQDRKDAVAADPQSWRVPLFVTAGGEPVRQVMDGGSATVSAPGCGPVIANAGQLGYYRTLYTPAMLGNLKSGFGKMKPIDQMGLIYDQYALAQADYQQYAPALDLVRAIPADANPRVASAGLTMYARLHEWLEGDDASLAKLAALADRQFGPRLQNLGFIPRSGEPLVDDQLRADLIGDLGMMGNARVEAEANRLFAQLSQNPEALDGPLKTTWLNVIARNADAAQWNRLLSMARNSKSAVEKANYYALLGRTADKALAKKALDLALTDEPGKTTSAAIIRSVGQSNPDMAVDFFLANESRIAPLIDDSARARFLAGLGGTSNDPAMIGKLQGYAAKQSEDQAAPIVRMIGMLKEEAKIRPRAVSQIKAWLAAQ